MCGHLPPLNLPRAHPLPHPPLYPPALALPRLLVLLVVLLVVVVCSSAAGQPDAIDVRLPGRALLRGVGWPLATTSGRFNLCLASYPLRALVRVISGQIWPRHQRPDFIFHDLAGERGRVGLGGAVHQL